jgi:hypothetical protein
MSHALSSTTGTQTFSIVNESAGTQSSSWFSFMSLIVSTDVSTGDSGLSNSVQPLSTTSANQPKSTHISPCASLFTTGDSACTDGTGISSNGVSSTLLSNPSANPSKSTHISPCVSLFVSAISTCTGGTEASSTGVSSTLLSNPSANQLKSTHIFSCISLFVSTVSDCPTDSVFSLSCTA